MNVLAEEQRKSNNKENQASRLVTFEECLPNAIQPVQEVEAPETASPELKELFHVEQVEDVLDSQYPSTSQSEQFNVRTKDIIAAVKHATAWNEANSESNEYKNTTNFIRPDSALKRWWDVHTALYIFYYWISFSLSFFCNSSHEETILILDLISLTMHYADVFLRLNTATDTGEPTKDRKELLAAYSKRHLAADAILGCPIDFIVWLVQGGTFGWKLTRVKNLACLWKLRTFLRIPESVIIVPRLVHFYFFIVPILQRVIWLVIVAHVLITMRMVLAPFDDPQTNGTCPKAPDSCTDTVQSKYLYSAFYDWAVLTTQGPSVVSIECMLFASLMCFMCLLLQGHVMAEMSTFMVVGNVKEQNSDMMRNSKAIMNHFDVPPSLQQEVLSFSYHTLGSSSNAALAQALSTLPNPIILEVFMYIKVTVIESIPMFHDLGLDCTLALAGCLEQRSAEPAEELITYGSQGREMYILMYGHADVLIPCGSTWRSVTILVRGELFGEMALLNPNSLRTASVCAMGYCDLFVLMTVDFQAVQQSFGHLQERMEMEANKRGLLKAPVSGVNLKREITCPMPLQTGEQPADMDEHVVVNLDASLGVSMCSSSGESTQSSSACAQKTTPGHTQSFSSARVSRHSTVKGAMFTTGSSYRTLDQRYKTQINLSAACPVEQSNIETNVVKRDNFTVPIIAGVRPLTQVMKDVMGRAENTMLQRIECTQEHLFSSMVDDLAELSTATQKFYTSSVGRIERLEQAMVLSGNRNSRTSTRKSLSNTHPFVVPHSPEGFGEFSPLEISFCPDPVRQYPQYLPH